MTSTITNYTLANNGASKNTLIWALICSILLHTLLTLVIPKFKFDQANKPDMLVVELSKQPDPPPVALPEPAKVEPIKPKIVSKPIIKPILLPTETKNEPTPPPPTEVIAIASKPEAPPSPVPPAPIVPHDPPQPIAPPDTSAARDSYGNTLWGAIGKHKQYPRIAQMRGWQGEAIVELQLDGNGKLKSKKIIQSSGYDALDKQALDMVEKAMPFPAPPEVLRGGSFSIKVPIPFKLE
ncbi:MAG: energy transducer TonB [Methylotenera sp.]|nr:energy transducer TonB [Methylotenera sp.]